MLIMGLLSVYGICKDVDLVRTDLVGEAQGTTWHITYFSKESVVSKGEIDSILVSIDSSLSVYKDYSLITAFNNSRTGMVIDDHFRKVVRRSLDVYRETKGYFDITIFPIVEAWGFATKKLKAAPDSATIRGLMDCVGSTYLQLRGHTLHKTKPGVKVDVNSIAQGYSVDVLAAFLESHGVVNYLVELGGEIHVRGHKFPDGKPFTVAIEAPPGDDDVSEPAEKIIALRSGAITTSGNYRKMMEMNGKTWSHLMDPHTGMSIQNELISVAVYAADAFTADAYDTPLMAMGLKEAMRFVERHRELAAFFIYRAPDGQIRDTASTRFRVLFK